MCDELLAQGGRAAQALEDELHIYVQALLIEGRIDDAADNPLPTDTGFWDVWERLHTGDAAWISPEPNT
jgi:hypothetical protein